MLTILQLEAKNAAIRGIIMRTNKEMKESLDKLIEQRYQMQEVGRVGGNRDDRKADVDLLEFCRDLLDQNEENTSDPQYLNYAMQSIAALERQDLLYQPIEGLPRPAKNVFDVVKHCPNSAVREKLLSKRNEDVKRHLMDFNEEKLLTIIATMDTNEINNCLVQLNEDGPSIPLIVLAVMMNSPRLLKILLEKNADPEVRIFPNPEVEQSGNLLVVAILLQRTKIVELLLDTPLSLSEHINTSISSGAVLSDIPWHIAVLAGNTELFNLLYRKGIDMNEKNAMGFDIFQLLQPEKNTQVYLHYENVCQEWLNKLSTLRQPPGVDTMPLQNELRVMNQLLQGGNGQHQQMLRFLVSEQRHAQNKEKGQAGKMQMWASAPRTDKTPQSVGEKRPSDEQVVNPKDKFSKR